MLDTLTPIARAAILMLEDEGAILEVSRQVSRAMKDEDVVGGIVGGVAVFQPGCRQTTDDIDIFADDGEQMGRALERAGFSWSSKRQRFFLADGVVPVQVLATDLALPPRAYIDIKEIRVACLADLLSMKVDSGSRVFRRAKDIADVIALIKELGLNEGMAAELHPSIQAEYRSILKRLR